LVGFAVPGLDAPVSAGEGRGEGARPSPAFTPIDTSRARFRTNVLANLAYFVLNAGLQLWFTRYLIDHLGVATYGLVPLATNITNYMAILTVALSGSVGRFLTIDLARGDIETANRTFNTSLFASIVLAAGLLPVAGALSWFAPSLLNIPAGQEMGTRFLLMCACFAFLLNAVGSSFACSTFAKNRFDVQRLIDGVGLVTQVGVILCLFYWVGSNLWYVGLGIAGSALVRQVCYQISWRKLTPEVRLRPRAFDRARLRELLGMGGWLTVSAGGWILYQSIDLPLLNTMVGATVAGTYAPLLQLDTMLRSVAGIAAGVLVPSITAHHARGDSDRVANTVVQAMRLLGLTMAVPVGIAAGLAGPLLDAWLGRGFAEQATTMRALVLPLATALPAMAAVPVYTATNRVSWAGLLVLCQGVLTVPLAVALVGVAGWGPTGVAAAKSTALLLGAVLFHPFYTGHILALPMSRFLKPVLASAAVAIAAAFAAYEATELCVVTGWPALLGLGSMVGLVAYGIVMMAVMTPSERATLHTLVMGARGPRRERSDG
jgi:membrane protein EpsK